jgi:hypothetical protein
MDRKQQSSEKPTVEQLQDERANAQPARQPRLRIDVLEERVAPSAIWGD